MPWTIDVEPGEEIILDTEYHVSTKSEPFAFAISNRAVFLPAKKTFAFTNDPYYFRRIPRSDVREIRIRRLKPFAMYVLAFVMIDVGLATTIGMFTPAYRAADGRIRGYPFAVLVAGVVLPFAVRGRFGLVVAHADRTYKWKPPLVVDRASKDHQAQLFAAIAEGSRRAGIPLVDERAPGV
jgi:hypothetical protein